MKKNKKKLLIYIPVLIMLLIQYYDKEGKFRLIQYIILFFMIVFVIYHKIIKKQN